MHNSLTTPIASPTRTALKLRGRTRLLSNGLWGLLVIGWLLYLFGFAWASIARADRVLCAPFTSTPDLISARGACMTVILGAESVAHTVFFVSALLLFARKSSELMTVLASGMLLLLSAGVSTVTLGLALVPEYQPLSRLMLAAGLWSAIVFLLLFPDGRFRPRWTAAIAGVYALWMLSWFVFPTLDVTRSLQVNIFPLFALATIPAIVVIWRGYRRYFTPTQQQQTKWAIVGAIGTPIVYLICSTLAVVATNMLQGTPLGLIVYAASFIGRWIGIMLIPLAIVFSIARYRLWDVDLVIGRAVAVGAVTLALIMVFMGALVAVQRIAGVLIGGDQSSLALAAASLAVAILFNPLRVRLRTAIDARFFPRHSQRLLQAAIAQPTLPSADADTDAITVSDVMTRGSKRTMLDGFVGERIAGYTLDTLIGRGGMAEVYRAHGSKPGREVAVKILSPMLARDVLYRARFEREGRMLADLSHPHIVRIFDAGFQDGIGYIVMELLTGESLAELLTRLGRLPLAQALPIVRGVASALSHAHANGVIHRDVKPHNIMLRAAGTGVHPILMDFGIARLVAAQTALTGDAGALGTLDYIAPEQIVETSRVDGRADMYALAIVAYQMLTGRLPFKESSAAAVILSHLQKPAPDPRAFQPDIPARTALAVLRALAKDPDDRFETIDAFAEAFG